MRTVTHATFVVERSYAPWPSRIFAAFADPEAKARWFAGGDAWDATRSDPAPSIALPIIRPQSCAAEQEHAQLAFR